MSAAFGAQQLSTPTVRGNVFDPLIDLMLFNFCSNPMLGITEGLHPVSENDSKGMVKEW